MVPAMKTALTAFLFSIAMTLCLPALSAGFVKFDGIEGESTDKAHKGWIDVLSVSHGVTPGDAAARQAERKRQHKPVTITKPIDKASPLLAEALASGAVLANVRIDVDGQVTVLESARVTAIETDGRGNEVITLMPWAGEQRPIRSTTRPEAVPAKKGNVETTWKVEKGEK